MIYNAMFTASAQVKRFCDEMVAVVAEESRVP